MNGTKREYKEFTDDNLSSLAAKFIQNTAKRKQPFALFLGLKAPHIPFAYLKRTLF